MESNLYDLFYEQERNHWWFQARKEIILKLIKDYIKPKEDLKILDIGCGTGMTMEALGKFGEVWGVDNNPKAIDYCRKRGLKNLILADFPSQVPLKEKFDLITFLDVLEHIEGDAKAIKTAKGLLEPGGVLLITVPAFQFLWSPHDIANHHVRRYDKEELSAKIQLAGFKIIKLSYYNFFLFLPTLIKKNIDRIKYKNLPKSHLNEKTSRLMNRIYKIIFSLEKNVLTHISFPVGVSLVAILKNE